MALGLLLARADDGEPALLDGLPAGALLGGGQDTGEIPESERLWEHGADPDDLEAQRWGLVAPEGPDGERLLALVEPLRRAREAAQGGAPARIYRVPPRMTAPEAMVWRKAALRPRGVPERELPRYLLLLGDLDQVSLELQQALGVDGFVGRLAFPADEGYAAYADKVLRWEAAAARQPKASALLFAARDGSPAMGMGYHRLLGPMRDALQEAQAQGALPVEEVVEVDGTGASADRLLSQASARRAGVLFTMSHGLGAPRAGWSSPEERRALQGALCLGPSSRLTARELVGTTFLPGGVWFCFACFGAGTPRRSAYEPWLRQMQPSSRRVGPVLAGLPHEGERPFVAALPQAALASPEGPLAVMGHADLAWTYSYQEPSGRNHPARFFGVLEALLKGSRAGVAAAALTRFAVEASLELSALDEEDAMARLEGRPPAVKPLARAQLWMTRQDLAGYVLLGDPAVRLPLVRAEAAQGAGEPSDAESLDELASELIGMPVSGGAPRALAPEDAERAVLALLGREGSAEEIAARHGLSPAQLRTLGEVFKAAGRAAVREWLGRAGTKNRR